MDFDALVLFRGTVSLRFSQCVESRARGMGTSISLCGCGENDGQPAIHSSVCSVSDTGHIAQCEFAPTMTTTPCP